MVDCVHMFTFFIFPVEDSLKLEEKENIHIMRTCMSSLHMFRCGDIIGEKIFMNFKKLKIQLSHLDHILDKSRWMFNTETDKG